MTELIDQLILQVITLKGPSAIVVFIIMLGYAAKMVPRFPNKCIPVVSFIIGPLLTPVLVGWPTPGSMDPGLRWPEAAAWVTSIVQGHLLACIAWISHAKILRKFIDDKIPALNPGLVVARSTSSVSDAEGTQRTEETLVSQEKPKNEQP